MWFRTHKGLYHLAVVGVLALGIGLNAAVASVWTSVMAPTLPYDESSRLILVRNDLERALQEDYPPELIESIAAFRTVDANLTVGGATRRVAVGLVSRSFLRVIGLEVQNGGGLERAPDGTRLIVLWRADETAGQVFLNGEAFQFAGSVNSEMTFPAGVHAWIPLDVAGDELLTGARWFRLVVRLREGVSHQAAGAWLATLRDNPSGDDRTAAILTPLGRYLSGAVPERVRYAQVVSLLLLIAAIVVAVALFRLALGPYIAAARIRAALGATNTQLLYEYVRFGAPWLAATGLSVAVVAFWAQRGIAAMLPQRLVRGVPVQFSFGIVAAVVSVTLAAGLLIALVGYPPLKRASEAPGLAPRALPRRELSGGWAAAGRGLQVAALTTLTVLALLVTRSYWIYSRIDPGLDLQNAVATRIFWDATTKDRSVTVEQLLHAVRGLSGVLNVGAVSHLPFVDRAGALFRVTSASGRGRLAAFRGATAGYFDAVGVRWVERPRTWSGGERPWAVITESLARSIGVSSGETVSIAGASHQVVGVVRDFQTDRLDRTAEDAVYVPLDEVLAPSTALVVRGTGIERGGLSARVSATLQAVLPFATVSQTARMDSIVSATYTDARHDAWFAWGLAALSVVIVGGAMFAAESASMRRGLRAIAVQLALGLTSAGVVREVLIRRGTVYAPAMALGVLASVPAASALRASLFQVDAFDTWATAGALAIVTTTVCLATIVGCVDAFRVDVAALLRSE